MRGPPHPQQSGCCAPVGVQNRGFVSLLFRQGRFRIFAHGRESKMHRAQGGWPTMQAARLCGAPGGRFFFFSFGGMQLANMHTEYKVCASLRSKTFACIELHWHLSLRDNNCKRFALPAASILLVGFEVLCFGLP